MSLSTVSARREHWMACAGIARNKTGFRQCAQMVCAEGTPVVWIVEVVAGMVEVVVVVTVEEAALGAG